MSERPRVKDAASSQGPTRCALCFDDLASDDDPNITCDGCQTTYHQACARELGGCATLGCAQFGRSVTTTGGEPAALDAARLEALRGQVQREREMLARRRVLHRGASDRVRARARGELVDAPIPRRARLVLAYLAGAFAVMPVAVGFELFHAPETLPALLGLLGTLLTGAWLAWLWLGSLRVPQHRRPDDGSDKGA